MEQKELQRKIFATIFATVTLCILLVASVFLLVTTDVFTLEIKILLLACCLILAIAIGGFLWSKIIEIRTLRLCMTNSESANNIYSEVENAEALNNQEGELNADVPQNLEADALNVMPSEENIAFNNESIEEVAFNAEPNTVSTAAPFGQQEGQTAQGQAQANTLNTVPNTASATVPLELEHEPVPVHVQNQTPQVPVQQEQRPENMQQTANTITINSSANTFDFVTPKSEQTSENSLNIEPNNVAQSTPQNTPEPSVQTSPQAGYNNSYAATQQTSGFNQANVGENYTANQTTQPPQTAQPPNTLFTQNTQAEQQKAAWERTSYAAVNNAPTFATEQSNTSFAANGAKTPVHSTQQTNTNGGLFTKTPESKPKKQTTNYFDMFKKQNEENKKAQEQRRAANLAFAKNRSEQLQNPAPKTAPEAVQSTPQTAAPYAGGAQGVNAANNIGLGGNNNRDMLSPYSRARKMYEEKIIEPSTQKEYYEKIKKENEMVEKSKENATAAVSAADDAAARASEAAERAEARLRALAGLADDDSTAPTNT